MGRLVDFGFWLWLSVVEDCGGCRGGLLYIGNGGGGGGGGGLHSIYYYLKFFFNDILM